MTPPIRFLALVLGVWTIARGFAWAPEAGSTPGTLQDEPAAAAGRVPRNEAQLPVASLREGAFGLHSGPVANADARRLADAAPARTQTPFVRAAITRADVPTPVLIAFGSPGLIESAPLFASPSAGPAVFPRPPPAQTAMAAPGPAALGRSPAAGLARAGRMSVDAWMLARGGDGAAALAAGDGLLGGSQVGTRVLYRIAGEPSAPLSLSARLSSPLRRNGAEAAVGVEWQPLAGLPVRVLAERRQRVAGTGRSAFALLAHGGLSDLPVAAEFRLDAYAQAGVVGARRRDLFADGGATLVRPLGSAPDGPAVGIGTWGGAQPGAARLDVGPRVTTTIGAAGVRARVSLDWRFRIAGAAAPGSGPALTVATGF